VYVPGNHDYRIFDYHSLERHLITPLREGRKLSGKISFFRNFAKSFLQGIISAPDAKIEVIYPHYTMKVNRRRIILTHGHFFDPNQAFNHEIGKVFSGRDPLTKEEIRKVRHAYFRRVSLYQNVVSGFSMKRELREWFSSLYEPMTAFSTKFLHRKHKSF